MTRRVLIGMAVVAALLTPGQARAAACAEPTAGGEWPMYGADLRNSRTQHAETTLNASTVPNVGPAWVFDTAGGGTFQNTPVVADGCVYAASSTGWVFAINALDGTTVWQTQLQGRPAGDLVGGVITGSPVVTDGKVYVAVSSQNEPYVAALDQATGAVLWTAPVLDPAKFNAAYQTTITAAPVVADGLIFQGIMAGEGSAGARGGYAILDAESGELIRQDWTITDAEYAAGYRGASIWCTGAYDEATKQVYACGGNPASKQREARHSNALLKFDLDPASPRFGDLVDAYKGTTDHYYPGLDQQPACDEVPTTLVWSPTCVQLDLDFGASPSLLTDHIGRTLVGDLQKSGIYHAAYADNMEQAWTAVVGTPGVPVNAASPAYDGTNVYTTAQMPGQIWGIEGDRGRIRWVQPLGEGTHYQSVSTANGVVYSLDNLGVLHAWDASNGVPVLAKPLSVDVGAHAGDLSSQGVSIAYNTIYAASSSYIVAYR